MLLLLIRCSHVLLVVVAASALSREQVVMDGQGKLLLSKATQNFVHSEVAFQAANELDVSVELQRTEEPVNFVISCAEDSPRLQRFRRHMEKNSLSFEVFPCLEPSLKDIQAAVHEGFLGPLAETHFAKHGGFLGVALSHMKLLQAIVSRGLPSANVFEDDEVIHDDYKEERSRVLESLAVQAEFINLNPLRPSGDKVPSADSRLHKLRPGLPANANVWFSNYYVSAAGAKHLLEILKGFDAGASGALEIDWKLAEAFGHDAAPLSGNGFFSLTTNALSTHCENVSTKDRHNRGSSFLQADPVCLENSVL